LGMTAWLPWDAPDALVICRANPSIITDAEVANSNCSHIS
jgi:hypothetical protein